MKISKKLKHEFYPKRFTDFDGIIPIGYDQLEQLFPGIISETLINIKVPFKAKMGHINRDELVFISSLVRWLEPNKIFEIGTFDGLTTINMAINAPSNSEIYTLDIPQNSIENSRFKIDDYNKSMIFNSYKKYYIKLFEKTFSNIHILEEDSGKFDFTNFYNQIDLVFVDGSHTFNYCYYDSMEAIKMVSEGGIILWHDYNKIVFNPGVTEALNKVCREEKKKMYWFNDPIINGGKTSIVLHINI